jgi:photosystem II stability/assembly factor-like uncharacterized protein
MLLILVLTAICSAGYSQVYQQILKDSKTKNFKEIVQQVEAYYQDKDKGKGSGYKQFKRWEYFHRKRLDANGNLINISGEEYDELNDYHDSRAANARIGGPSTVPGNWQPLGPLTHNFSNQNGRINTIVVDPHNSRYIYAGSPSGGLWRSVDDGKSWQCLTDNISSCVGISSIVIDPRSPVANRTLYILTGDKDGGDTNFIGIFKSIDNGSSWSKVDFAYPYAFSMYNKLVMHPGNSKIFFMINQEGIFKSTTQGTTWVLEAEGNFSDLEFNPTNPAIMYATGEAGTYRSINSGDNWKKVTSIIPTSDRNELAVSPADPDYVYLFIGQRSVASLYRSTDKGLTFSKIATDMNMQSVALGQYHYNLAMAVSPTDAETVFVGGIYAYKSTDGGRQWSIEYFGHVDFHSLDFYNGWLYAGNDGGIVRQNAEAGIPYQDLSQGFSVSQIYSLGIDHQDSDHILIGTQDNGAIDLTKTKGKAIHEGDGMECFIDPLNPSIWYTSTQHGDLYRTDNGGEELKYIKPPVQGGMWFTPFIMDPSDNRVIYAAYQDVWKNTMRGDVPWVNITNGAAGSEYVEAIAVAPSNSNFIYLAKWATNSYVLYKTTDGGKTWNTITLPENTSVTDIAIHPMNPNILWVSSGAFGYVKAARSMNGGGTWTDLTGSLPDAPANSIAYQKGSNNGIYLGTDLGVFYRDDSMTDWIPFDDGIPYSIVTDLEINAEKGKIYAATYGRGAWISNVHVNGLPVVSITKPAQDQIYQAPASITINAVATDKGGSIARVEFYSGTKLLFSDATSPYSYVFRNVRAGNYKLIAKAIDNTGGVDTTSVSVTVNPGLACLGAGSINLETWTDVSGTSISSIPVTNAPDETQALLEFKSSSNTGDRYGSRVRGYLCVPATGNYTFWIASNDNSELWLSPDDDDENKIKIASVIGATNPLQWDKFPSQRSAAIKLIAGQRYYIEALHKEGTGSDHLAVGLQMPDETFARPIPGSMLIPFMPLDNDAPSITITQSLHAENTQSSATTITINAQANDRDGSIKKIEFYHGEMKLGEDLTSPYSFTWSNVQPGSYAIHAKATDNLNAVSTSSGINIQVNATCLATGTISIEYWEGVSGTSVNAIPSSMPPSRDGNLGTFEISGSASTNYGTRVRGYICAPANGNYTFWISSNDNSELWLSTDSDPDQKVKIASVSGATNSQEWNKFTSQQSLPVPLMQNKRYYIEALHKQGAGAGNLAVGWQLPNGILERPISGSRLSPFGTDVSSAARPGQERTNSANRLEAFSIFPNPVTDGNVTLSITLPEMENHNLGGILSIITVTGETIHSQSIQCNVSCSALEVTLNKDLTAGVYLVNVTINERRFSQRLFVQ